ncbi:MAG: N-acetyltransferase [Sulfobacillus benefaciens]|uniref:N-acetyltransferase n=1 Tax=Sulfobacillus benefaciens TaxID=453960 RepID=A0A2T2X2H3_9FIRM|nr:MAG: N-acetyltransferase [Sulfobacillus benefaciens]
MSVDVATYYDRENHPYVVREAVPGDASDIVGLITEVGMEGEFIANEGEYYSVEKQQRILAERPQGQLVIVALVNNRIIGTLEAIRGTFRKNRHVATMGMALRKEYRGSTRGSGLLATLDQWSRQEDVKKIAISVFESNKTAIHFYQRYGFFIEGSRPNQFNIAGKMVAEVFMAKYLL